MATRENTIARYRCWAYGRISRDEDEKLLSMSNQMDINIKWITNNGHILVGETFDDNKTGMNFDREGFNEALVAAEDGLIDAIVVKDLSRLGRHRSETDRVIEYLLRCDVRVISVTEGIDTSNEDEDLNIGMRLVMNDFYARDSARKIRAGYRNKQQEVGVVILPPFGYQKDKYTKEVTIYEETADIVKFIFEKFLEGHGVRRLTQLLSEEKVPSPSYYQRILYNKRKRKDQTKINDLNLWSDKTVSRILSDKSYIGVLVNHKSERSKIERTTKIIPPEEHSEHPGYFPPIISEEIWHKVQDVRKSRVRHNVKGGSYGKVYRYAGLLKCSECNSSFTAKKRDIGKPNQWVEYVCSTYHRIGSYACTSHRIRESVLDDLLYRELRRIRKVADKNWSSIQNLVNQMVATEDDTAQLITNLESQIGGLRVENQGHLRTLATYPDFEKDIKVLLDENNSRIKKMEARVESINNCRTQYDGNLVKLETSIALLDEIISERTISDTTLQLLVERISVKQVDDRFNLVFQLKAPYQTHTEIYNRLIVLQKSQDYGMIDVVDAITG